MPNTLITLKQFNALVYWHKTNTVVNVDEHLNDLVYWHKTNNTTPKFIDLVYWHKINIILSPNHNFNNRVYWHKTNNSSTAITHFNDTVYWYKTNNHSTAITHFNDTVYWHKTNNRARVESSQFNQHVYWHKSNNIIGENEQFNNYIYWYKTNNAIVTDDQFNTFVYWHKTNTSTSNNTRFNNCVYWHKTNNVSGAHGHLNNHVYWHKTNNVSGAHAHLNNRVYWHKTNNVSGAHGHFNNHVYWHKTNNVSDAHEHFNKFIYWFKTNTTPRIIPFYTQKDPSLARLDERLSTLPTVPMNADDGISPLDIQLQTLEETPSTTKPLSPTHTELPNKFKGKQYKPLVKLSEYTPPTFNNRKTATDAIDKYFSDRQKSDPPSAPSDNPRLVKSSVEEVSEDELSEDERSISDADSDDESSESTSTTLQQDFDAIIDKLRAAQTRLNDDDSYPHKEIYAKDIDKVIDTIEYIQDRKLKTADKPVVVTPYFYQPPSNVHPIQPPLQPKDTPTPISNPDNMSFADFNQLFM